MGHDIAFRGALHVLYGAVRYVLGTFRSISQLCACVLACSSLNQRKKVTSNHFSFKPSPARSYYQKVPYCQDSCIFRHHLALHFGFSVGIPGRKCITVTKVTPGWNGLHCTTICPATEGQIAEFIFKRLYTQQIVFILRTCLFPCPPRRVDEVGESVFK
jgi:hypothetical protein